MMQGSGPVAVLGLLTRWDFSVLGAGMDHMQSGDDHVLDDLDGARNKLSAIMAICDPYQMQRFSVIPPPLDQFISSSDCLNGLRYLVLDLKAAYPEYSFMPPYSEWTTPPSAQWLNRHHPEAVAPPTAPAGN